MHKTIRMIAASGATFLAATAFTLAAAAPAQADPVDCVAYLESLGYTARQQVEAACSGGENPFGGGCTDALSSLDVAREHAVEACRRAAA